MDGPKDYPTKQNEPDKCHMHHLCVKSKDNNELITKQKQARRCRKQTYDHHRGKRGGLN